MDSLNTIDVAAGQTLIGARSSLGTSLNFELPAEWVTEGRVHLQLDRLEIEDAQSTLPCIACENNVIGPSIVNFHRVPPIRLWLVSVPYRTAPGATPNMPTQSDIDHLASWIRRAYPASEVQITQASMPVQSDKPGYKDEDDDGIDENRDGFLCKDLNERLADWAATMPSQPRQTRYYGMVSDSGGNFMRGCAPFGSQYGSGPTGCCPGWDTDGSYADWYGGHEIGHLFDRRHPDGGCEDSNDDDNFPYSGGLIGNPIFDNQGLDAGDSALGIPFAVNDWRVGWSDVMTYCDFEWVSSYTYRGILRNLCGNDKPNCPDNGQLVGRRPALASAAAPAGKAKKPKVRLTVNGSLDLRKDKVRLGPMSALEGLALTDRPRKGSYAIVLGGAGGRELARYPFEPREISDLPTGQRVASINEVVPFDRSAERIEIVKGGRALFSKPVSAHAPEASLRGPKGKRLNKPTRLRWRASDADGGKPTVTLQYAADGKSFVTIAAGLEKRSLLVDPKTLPGGSKARFRVIATDGVLTGIDTSGRVRVEAKPPRVSIATPRDGVRLVEGETVGLIASVSDPQDVRLGGDAVVWRSSLQGELGRGAALSATLGPGSHAITATATNRHGKSATSTITIEVDAVPEAIDAVLLP